MPRGFIGLAAALYLGRVSEAHTEATDAGKQRPAHAPPAPRDRVLPFTPQEAFTGRHTVGRGDSSNIVSDQRDYQQACYLIDQADYRMGHCIHQTITEIEELCRTSFILPAAAPKCTGVSDSVKQSLGRFGAVTSDATMQALNFAREIAEVK